MKKFLFAMIAFFSAISVSAQQYYGRVSDPDGYTNIRRGASTSSPIVRRYSSGDYLYYTPVGNGWSKVYSGARSSTFMGYMHTSRIVRVNPNGRGDSSPSLYSGYITDPVDNYVNVRKGPGTNYGIVTRLYVGDFVYYSKTNSNWVKVYNSSKRYLGYVYRDRIY